MKEILCWTLASLYNIARVNRPTPAEVVRFSLADWDTADWFEDPTHRENWYLWTNYTWGTDLRTHTHDAFTASSNVTMETGEIPASYETLSASLWKALRGAFSCTGNFLNSTLGSDYCADIYPPCPEPTPPAPSPTPPEPTPESSTEEPTTEESSSSEESSTVETSTEPETSSEPESSSEPGPEPTPTLDGRSFTFQQSFISMPLIESVTHLRLRDAPQQVWTFPLSETTTGATVPYCNAVVFVWVAQRAEEAEFTVTQDAQKGSKNSGIVLGGATLPDDYVVYEVPEQQGTNIAVPEWVAQKNFEIKGTLTSSSGVSLSSFKTDIEQGQGTAYTEGTWLVADTTTKQVYGTELIQLTGKLAYTGTPELYAVMNLQLRDPESEIPLSWSNVQDIAYFYGAPSYPRWKNGSWFGSALAEGYNSKSEKYGVNLAMDFSLFDESNATKPSVFGSYEETATFEKESPVVKLTYTETDEEISIVVPPVLQLKKRQEGSTATPLVVSTTQPSIWTRAVRRTGTTATVLAYSASMAPLGDYVDGAILAWGIPGGDIDNIEIDISSISENATNYESIGVAANLPLKGAYRVYDHEVKDGVVIYLAIPEWIMEKAFLCKISARGLGSFSDSYYVIDSIELKALQEDSPSYTEGAWLVVDTEDGGAGASFGDGDTRTSFTAPVYMHNSELVAEMTAQLLVHDAQGGVAEQQFNSVTIDGTKNVGVSNAYISELNEDLLTINTDTFTGMVSLTETSLYLLIDVNLKPQSLPVSLKAVSDYYDFYTDIGSIMISKNYTALGVSAGGFYVTATEEAADAPTVWKWTPSLVAIPLVKKKAIPEPPRGKTLAVKDTIKLNSVTYNTGDDLANIEPVLLNIIETSPAPVYHITLGDNNDTYIDSGIVTWGAAVTSLYSPGELNSTYCTKVQGATRNMVRVGGNYPLKGEFDTWKCNVTTMYPESVYMAVPAWAEQWKLSFKANPDEPTVLIPDSFTGLAVGESGAASEYYTAGAWLVGEDTLNLNGTFEKNRNYYINASVGGTTYNVTYYSSNIPPGSSVETWTRQAVVQDPILSLQQAWRDGADIFYSVVNFNIIDGYKFPAGLAEALSKAKLIPYTYMQETYYAQSPSGWNYRYSNSGWYVMFSPSVLVIPLEKNTAQAPRSSTELYVLRERRAHRRVMRAI